MVYNNLFLLSIPSKTSIYHIIQQIRKNKNAILRYELYSSKPVLKIYLLYNESIASFKTGDLYDHHDADGFINLFGLSLKVRAMKEQELSKKNNK